MGSSCVRRESVEEREMMTEAFGEGGAGSRGGGEGGESGR